MERQSQGQLAVYDAIVIGAGIYGMSMLHRLRELGMLAEGFPNMLMVLGPAHRARQYSAGRLTQR